MSPESSIRKHNAKITKPSTVDTVILLSASPKKKKPAFGARNPIKAIKAIEKNETGFLAISSGISAKKRAITKNTKISEKITKNTENEAIM